jgi:hypothetical protein
MKVRRSSCLQPAFSRCLIGGDSVESGTGEWYGPYIRTNSSLTALVVTIFYPSNYTRTLAEHENLVLPAGLGDRSDHHTHRPSVPASSFTWQTVHTLDGVLSDYLYTDLRSDDNRLVPSTGRQDAGQVREKMM